MAQGLSHREIAEVLGIGYQSVRKHIVAIYDRLRKDLVMVWRRDDFQ